MFFFWYFSEEENNAYFDQVIVNNRELIYGMLVTAMIGIAFEIFVRFVNCIIWTIHSENSLGIFMAVWLPQMILFFFVTFTFICVHVIKIIIGQRLDGPFLYRILQSCTCMSNFNIVLPIMQTTFTLCHCFFPAIILILAYPTSMITIFAFIPAYLFATTVFVAILIKLHRLFSEIHRMIICIFTAFVTAGLLLSYAVILIFLYSLIVGRGCAVNTGPLFIISLLPPAFIMVGSWIAERILLKN